MACLAVELFHAFKEGGVIEAGLHEIFEHGVAGGLGGRHELICIGWGVTFREDGVRVHGSELLNLNCINYNIRLEVNIITAHATKRQRLHRDRNIQKIEIVL